MKLFADVQRIENGEPIKCILDGKEEELVIKLVYPADMASHWALFHEGGLGSHKRAKPCHHCNCTYGELGHVFDIYDVKKGDTLASIAKAHGTFVKELRLNKADEGLAYYLHTLAAHGGEYMLFCVLGKYMNEALEAHHLISWRLVGLTFKGGRPGNPFTVKGEDGKFDKTSELQHEHTTQLVTETVLQAQNRLLFPKVAYDLDTAVWEGKGYMQPEVPTDWVQFFKSHAPSADLVPARQTLRRLQKSLEREKDVLHTCRRPGTAPWRMETQKRFIQLRAASVRKQQAIVASLERACREKRNV
ncbi:hypothetical protein CYMTET_45018 [Cymbomonas tetramitiformis]|uniref:LysM domain-containing protein n=1 Tax=Cymbomonas tetramitiformis TaxID=36881 RepID=A0AAE0C0W1_9CHLO|nr:hypothetical protein CYMTET_45018 [Cymbomonas tetramitiformis]